MPRAKTTSEIEHYIFIANSVEYDPFTTGLEITRALAERNIWLASRFTPFRHAFKSGDRVLLYVAGAGSRHFVGDAEISGETTEATKEDRAVAVMLGLDGFAEKIPLKGAVLWKDPVAIRPLVDELTFIKDKVNYGLNLRQAAVRIPAGDYEMILSKKEL